MKTPNYQMVVGLTGPIASGKGLVAKGVSNALGDTARTDNILLSDFLREDVRAAGQPLNRDTLRERGNELRQKNGAGALVKRIFDTLPKGGGVLLVVDSIRNPGEIRALRDAYGDRLLVIATDAPLEDRIKRVIGREREDDSTDPQEIERQMRVEMEHSPEFGFALDECRELADFVSIARESKAERLDEIIRELTEFSDRTKERPEHLRERRAAM